MLILVFLSTFLFMEFVAWFAHKFIMHGFLWYLHEDHHTRENDGFFEKNDAFFLIFATPSALGLIFGSVYNLPILITIGFGVLAYGISYFLVHDVFIHQRFKWLRRTNNIYFRAIRKAHKVHHKYRGKEDGECFGMLIIPFKYLAQELKINKQG